MSAKNWSFTINNPNEDDTVTLDNLECNFIIYQLERGDNDTPHYQGYVQFKSRIRLTTAKTRISPRAHLEIARGTADQNIDYCTKLTGRLHDPIRRGIPIRERQRTDLIDFKNKIKEGANDAILIDEFTDQYFKYQRVIGHVRMAFTTNRNWQMEVYVYWGPSGSGKTRLAYEQAGEDNYFVSKGDQNQITWWDGYHGQASVVLDDFYGNQPSHPVLNSPEPLGWLPWSFMLRILDRYPFNVQIKGGTIPFTSKKIYITSNVAPEQWYKNVPNNDMTPLLRRITQIINLV